MLFSLIQTNKAMLLILPKELLVMVANLLLSLGIHFQHLKHSLQLKVRNLLLVK